MSRAILLPLSLGSLLLSVAGCDDPTRPNPDAQLARGTLADGPTYISAGAVSTSEISIGWDDNSRNEGGFELHRSTTGAAGTYSLLIRTGANVIGHSDQGLTQGAEYCYKVRSFKVSGKTTSVSAFTDFTCIRTKNPPPAPASVSAVPAAGGVIDVTWTQPTSTVNGFRVERAALPAGPWQTVAWSASISAFRDTGRPTETQACYRIFAYNNDGDSPASVADCTTPPAPPAGITATSTDAQSITVTWTDNSAVEDGFEVQRSLGDGNWSVIASPPANATTYADAGLTTDTRYFYRVRARKDGGFSAFTFTASALVVGSAPPAPTDIAAYGFTSRGTGVSWTSSAANVEGFRIERSTNGQLSWETAGTTPSNHRSFGEGNRLPDQQVCYRIYAVNRVGESPASAADCVIPPAAATNLTATPAGNGSIDLAWTNPSTAATQVSIQYLVRWNPGYCYYSYYCYGYDQWVEIDRVAASVTSYRATGLSAESAHDFVVVTLAPDAFGDASNVASSLTEPTPVAPSNVTASNVAPGSVEVQWSDNSDNEHGFSIQRCTGTQAACGDGGDFVPIRWVPPNSTSGADTGVAPATTYTYRVVALAGAATSVSTNLATVTTPALPDE